MMDVRPQTIEFLRELERSANRKLMFPGEVGQFLDAARQSGTMEVFEDVIFQAKFITKSAAVMKRIGPDGEGFDKLSVEVEAAIRKGSALLKSISATCTAEAAQRQSAMFFAMNHESLDRLMELFSDLTIVKNWVLDKKPLP